MIPRHRKYPIVGVLAPLAFGLGLLGLVACGSAEDEEGEGQEAAETQEGPLPAVVMDALTARFPGAQVRQWTREEEEGTVLYDIEFTQEGRMSEADIRADGGYVNFEVAIGADELPEAVSATVEGRFPEATLQEIMQITAVTSEGEVLEGYEVVVLTANGEETEITVAPDGTILEEGGDEAGEEGGDEGRA